MKHETFSTLLVALGCALPLPALATIVIGNPTYGQAWSPQGAPVAEMSAPVAEVRPYFCDGSPAQPMAVHQTWDMVAVQGVPLPLGTWCHIDIVLEGSIKVRVGGVTTFLDTPVIHLFEQTPVEGYKLVMHGTQGELIADIQ